jgi:hypothetical protein
MKKPFLISFVLTFLLPLLGMHRYVAPSGGSGSATYANYFTATLCSSSPPSCSAPIATGAIPSGKLIVVTVSEYGAPNAGYAQEPITLTDDAGSSYTVSPEGFIVSKDVSSAYNSIEQFYTCSSGAGGGTSFHAAVSLNTSPFMMVTATVYSYTGTCSLDAHASGGVSNPSYAFSVTSGTLTTTVANDLLVAGALNQTDMATTAGSDGASGTYTLRANYFVAQEDISEASTGTYSASISGSASTTWNIGLLAFKF